jgi:hypothetical protein
MFPRTPRQTNAITDVYELIDLEDNAEPQYEELFPRTRRRWREDQFWVFGCVGVALLGAGLYLWGGLSILGFVRESKEGFSLRPNWPRQA